MSSSNPNNNNNNSLGNSNINNHTQSTSDSLRRDARRDTSQPLQDSLGNPNNSNNNANQLSDAGPQPAPAEATTNPSSSASTNILPPRRPRWSQTTGTTIFSYNPITRQLVPIAGTPPVTTWSTTNPLGGPPPATAPAPITATAQGEPEGPPGFPGFPGLPGLIDGPWNSPFEGGPFTEGTQVSTHLSFSTADGRAIPLTVMRQFLSGLGGAGTPTTGASTGGAGGGAATPAGAGGPALAPTLEQLLAQHAQTHMENASRPPQDPTQVGPPAGGLGQEPQEPPPTIGGHNLRPRQRPRAASVPPLSTNSTAPTAGPGPGANPPNADGPANGGGAGGAPFMPPGWTMAGIPGLPPGIQGLGFQAVPPLPGLPPGLAGFGFPGMTFGPFMAGIPGMGMEMERPPDTRRAKELLRGLTAVPRGLVKRMERVEKMLGNESAESGKLVCAVCYDPLLRDSDAAAAATADVIMDEADTEDADEDNTKSKSKSAKTKHPSLDPNALIALPCTHVFHAVDCLLPWFEQGKTTCPTCRFDVDPRSETLNLARWLGRRRTRTTTAPTTGTEGMPAVPANNAAAFGTVPNPPAAAAATEDTRMEGDDEEDAGEFIEEEGESDVSAVFRDTIRRALISALGQALMPQAGDDQAPPNANANAPTPGTANNAPTGLPTGGQPDPWAPNALRDFMMLDVFGPSGDMPGSDPLVPTDIELPGANRDQDGRMLRGDGESSVAATANSTPHTTNTELPRASGSEPSRSYPNTRSRRENAPSPSPEVQPQPQQQQPAANPPEAAERIGRSLFDWSRYTGFFHRGTPATAAQEQPVAGPSNSTLNQTASSSTSAASSRPATPRHHPYANARPAPSSRSTSNLNPNPTPANAPEPSMMGFAPRMETAPNGPTTFSFGSEMNNGNGRMSITRHSITFNLAVPLASLINPGAGAGAPPANGANAQQQPQPGAGAAATGSRITDVFNSMLFGLTPLGGATAGPAAGPNAGTTAPGTTGVNRTERSRVPRKKWIAPEGTSLRSVIESKERQVGLRCDDVSCLYGPEDGDEENADVKIRTERTCLRKNPGSAEPSCVHTYHPECLLVASRVADIGLDREMDSDGPDEWLEVGCPFCRVHGGQEKREWRNHRELASRV